MASITSRDGLKDYCLRRLGFPVIEINVDDDQVEDRIDDAFQFYFDYHYDGVEKMFYAYEVTQQTIDDGYLTIPDALMSVLRVLPFGGSNGNMYPLGDPSLAWDMSMHNPFKMIGGFSTQPGAVATRADQAGGDSGMDILGFWLNMQKYDLIQSLFAGEVPIRFNRHTNRVYIDTDVKDILSVGSFLVVEGWATLDPEVYTDVYNDRWLKRYSTALIKQQWGANLIKYSGIQLPGGVTLDGDKIFQEAKDEIAKLEEEMQMKYEEPVNMYMG